MSRIWSFNTGVNVACAVFYAGLGQAEAWTFTCAALACLAAAIATAHDERKV